MATRQATTRYAQPRRPKAPAQPTELELRQKRAEFYREELRNSRALTLAEVRAAGERADQRMRESGMLGGDTLQAREDLKDTPTWLRRTLPYASGITQPFGWLVDQLPGEAASKPYREKLEMMAGGVTAAGQNRIADVVGRTAAAFTDPVTLAAYGSGLGFLEFARKALVARGAAPWIGGLAGRVAQEAALGTAVEYPLALSRNSQNPGLDAAIGGAFGGAVPVIGAAGRKVLGFNQYPDLLDPAVEQAKQVMGGSRIVRDDEAFRSYSAGSELESFTQRTANELADEAQEGDDMLVLLSELQARKADALAAQQSIDATLEANRAANAARGEWEKSVATIPPQPTDPRVDAINARIQEIRDMGGAGYTPRLTNEWIALHEDWGRIRRGEDLVREVPTGQERFLAQKARRQQMLSPRPAELPLPRPEVEADVAARAVDKSDLIREAEQLADPDEIDALIADGMSREDALRLAVPEVDIPDVARRGVEVVPVKDAPEPTVKESLTVADTPAIGSEQDAARARWREIYERGVSSQQLTAPARTPRQIADEVAAFDYVAPSSKKLDDVVKMSQGEIEAYNVKQVAANAFGRRKLVEDALREGKPVPPEVLADYPDLAVSPPGTVSGTGKSAGGEISFDITRAPALLPNNKTLAGQRDLPSFITKLAREDADFRANPIATFEKGKLVVRDGATYRFEPEIFGFRAGELAEGQVVRFDLGALKAESASRKALLASLNKMGAAELKAAGAKGGNKGQLVASLAEQRIAAGAHRPSSVTPPPTMRLNSGVPLDLMITEGLRAGKWATQHTLAAARWAFDTLGDGVRSMGEFARAMIGQFGRAIRQHIPAAWQRFKKMVAQNNEYRQRTMRLRTKGGIDPREGLPKGRVAKIEAQARAVERQKMAQANAAKQELREQATDIVMEGLPPNTPDRGRRIKDVRDATTPRRVEIVKEKVDKARRKLDNKADADAVFKELSKIIKGGKSKAINRAARNPDFDGDFNAIAGLGVKNPRKGPTIGAVRDMEPEQRQNVLDAYANLRYRYMQYRNNLNLKAAVDKQAAEIGQELASSGKKELPVQPGSTSDRESGVLKKLGRAMLQPERLTQGLGKTVKRYVYDPINNARTAHIRRYRGYNEQLADNLRKAGFNPDDAKWRNSVSGPTARTRDVVVGGEAFKMTDAQFATLLANLDDSITFNKIERGMPVSMSHNLADARPLSDDELSMIFDGASEADWAFARAVKGVMNTSLQDDLFRAMMDIYGYAPKRRSDYFPEMRNAESAVDDLEDVFKPDMPGRVENRSQTKARRNGTDAPLIIGDILAIADRHFQQAAAIVELSRPARQVLGLLGTKKFKDAITKYHGADAVEDLTKFVRDVIEDAGAFRRPLDVVDSAFGKVVGNVGAGLIGMNPASILKQFPAIIKAGVEIEPKYLIEAVGQAIPTKFLSKTAKAIDDRMMQHSPQIWARYNMHANRLIGDMRQSTIARTRRTIGEKGMFGILAADRGIVRTIWRAAELKVAATKPGLKGDAYWEAVNTTADEVIRRTQQNFDLVNSSAIQRKGRDNAFMKAATMFMSEQNTNLNMIYDAVTSKNAKKMAAVLGTTVIANSVLVSLVDEARDTALGRSENEDMGDLATAVAADIIPNNLAQIYVAGPFLEWMTKQATDVALEAATGEGLKGRVYEPSNPLSSSAMRVGRGFKQMLAAMASEDEDLRAKSVKDVISGLSALSGIPLSSPISIGWSILEQATEPVEDDGRPDRPTRPERPSRPER